MSKSQNPLDGLSVNVTTIRWLVSMFPPDDDRVRYAYVCIERREGDRFAVTDDAIPTRHVNSAGRWVYPSSTPDVRGTCWHDWDTATALATKKAVQAAEEWAVIHRNRTGTRKAPGDMTKAELLAECRLLGVAPRGGLSRATRRDLQNWVEMNRRSV